MQILDRKNYLKHESLILSHSWYMIQFPFGKVQYTADVSLYKMESTLVLLTFWIQTALNYLHISITFNLRTCRHKYANNKNMQKQGKYPTLWYQFIYKWYVHYYCMFLSIFMWTWKAKWKIVYCPRKALKTFSILNILYIRITSFFSAKRRNVITIPTTCWLPCARHNG